MSKIYSLAETIDYLQAAHPLAEFRSLRPVDEVGEDGEDAVMCEDIDFTLGEIAMAMGHGEWDNGGEFFDAHTTPHCEDGDVIAYYTLASNTREGHDLLVKFKGRLCDSDVHEGSLVFRIHQVLKVIPIQYTDFPEYTEVF